MKIKYLLYTFLCIITGQLSYSQNDNDTLNIIKESKDFTINEDISINKVDIFPVFPNCNGDNDYLKKCLSEGINEHVAKAFNKYLVRDSTLVPGIKKILVIFRINKNGIIDNIVARARHPLLKEEATRVISLLPKMLPAKLNGKEVGVIYTLPMTVFINKIENKEDVTKDSIFELKYDEFPVYPGCEKNITNETLLKCMTNKVRRHISKKFNWNISDRLGIPPGKKRIYVMFKIDKNGFVRDIKSRAPHRLLENETIRVISKLPRMKPAKLNGKEVDIKISLPISFIVKSNEPNQMFNDNWSRW